MTRGNAQEKDTNLSPLPNTTELSNGNTSLLLFHS